MVAELGRRGKGTKESGAFLLADRTQPSRRVRRVVYIDDLDPNCLQGAICFDGRAYSALWDICDAEEMRVIGDVHTHPGRGVRQSAIDQDNPMVALPGHVALIVPGLAVKAVAPCDVGVHEYLGEQGWRSWTHREAGRRLYVGRWPGR
jgi:proteasome lid subunit RPN8/RPN11